MNSKLIFIRPAIPQNTSDLLGLETNLLAYSNQLKNLHKKKKKKKPCKFAN